MHRFSIIVPLLGDLRSFHDTLASVLRYRPRKSQVIVVHDGRYEDPYELGGEIDLVSSEATPQLVEFFETGLCASTGELIAMIRPGVEMEEGWSDPVEVAFEDDNVASVTPILVTPSQPNTIVAAGVSKGQGFRRRISSSNSKLTPRTIRRANPVGPTSWAAFYRTSALRQIEVFDEVLDSHYLDLDLALSLQTMGYQNVVCPDSVFAIDDPTLVESELTMPHGESAQRAYRRHTQRPASWLVSTCVVAAEIVGSPFQPWKLIHAFQRLGARRLARHDDEYASQISVVARQRRHLDAVEVRKPNHVPMTDASLGSRPAQSIADRRAA